MAKESIILLPQLQKYLSTVGEQIRLARLRWKLSAARVAERAAISRPTLLAIEKGTASVSAYVQVLFVLGLEKTVLRLAEDDVLGRKLQDAALLVKERAPSNPRTVDSWPSQSNANESPFMPTGTDWPRLS